MAGVVLQPLLIIKINIKRDYWLKRSSAAPPDALVISYKTITATFDPHQYLEMKTTR